MTQAKNGNTVKVNYTGRLDSGTVFDSTEDREPLEFVLGETRLIGGFEKAVVGMSPGEKKTVRLAPEEAYGPRRGEMVVKIGREQFSSDVNLQVGQTLQLRASDGRPIDARVAEVNDSDVTVDANHPLSGETLTFEIALLEVA